MNKKILVLTIFIFFNFEKNFINKIIYLKYIIFLYYINNLLYSIIL